jgi:predicted Zn-dependent protease
VAPGPPRPGGRVTLLSRLDGLVVGDNAAHGMFAGQLFLHADYDLAVEMPAGWNTANSPEVAGAMAPSETAAILLQVVGSGDDPVAGARADGLSEAPAKRLRRLQIAQMPAATITASTRDGHRVALTWIAHRKRIFRVTAVCEGADWERYHGEFERTMASARPLRPEDQARITQSRLHIRPARAGESLAQVLARGGAAWSLAQAAVANGVKAEQPLARDWPVKVAVSERYRP